MPGSTSVGGSCAPAHSPAGLGVPPPARQLMWVREKKMLVWFTPHSLRVRGKKQLFSKGVCNMDVLFVRAVSFNCTRAHTQTHTPGCDAFTGRGGSDAVTHTRRDSLGRMSSRSERSEVNSRCSCRGSDTIVLSCDSSAPCKPETDTRDDASERRK